MNERNTGGPAFPDGSLNDWGRAYNSGMTLRDYFAAMAMQGDMADGIATNEFAWCVERAYKMADAMLEARSK